MLELTVFLSGAFVMILEMVGGRVLAPHVGTSAIVWTSLIGVVLAALAFGSWAGGKFADRHLSRKGLARTLAAAGAGCAITAFCHGSICSAITAHVGNLYAGAVLAAIGVFAIPAFFFGAVTPYVVRLRLAALDTAGATVGRLYALSTAGSILGTFLGGFVLISWFSSTTILWALGCAMLLLSLCNAPARPILRMGCLALFVFLAWQASASASRLAENGGVRYLESPYNTIRLMEGIDNARAGQRVRLMATDPGYTQSGMLLDDPNELYFDYTRFYALGSQYVPEARSILMLGGGGYSVPKWLLSDKSIFGHNPDLELTVVELDPVMTEVAREYFQLPDDPRLSVEHQDARAFLNSQDRQYDLVFVDVFNSHYSIPFQMGTAEAVAGMKRAVAPGGALLMNIISAVEGEDGRLFRSIHANLANQFPKVAVYCVGRPGEPEKVQNLMVVAFADPAAEDRPAPQTAVSPSAQEIANMQRHRLQKPVPDDTAPLTDEFSPVERFALMLLK